MAWETSRKDFRFLWEAITVLVRARKWPNETLAGLERWCASVNLEGEQLALTVRSAEILPDLLRHLVASSADIYSFTPQKTSLEDMFVRIMGEDRGL